MFTVARWVFLQRSNVYRLEFSPEELALVTAAYLTGILAAKHESSMMVESGAAVARLHIDRLSEEADALSNVICAADMHRIKDTPIYNDVDGSART